MPSLWVMMGHHAGLIWACGIATHIWMVRCTRMTVPGSGDVVFPLVLVVEVQRRAGWRRIEALHPDSLGAAVDVLRRSGGGACRTGHAGGGVAASGVALWLPEPSLQWLRWC